MTDLEGLITKEEILEAGRSQKLLPPKSSFHHVADYKGKLYPPILLSVLFRMKFPDSGAQ